jgi:protein-S-isoprenylcysteine O-methyltransferase Ste14
VTDIRINVLIIGFFLATFLAIVCLLSVIITLIWRKMIEMRLVENEKDLLKQLTDDNYRPGWHRIVMAPFTPPVNDQIPEPPPYQY